MRRALLSGTGGVAAAFLGSLCCVGPLIFVTLGVGAGLASTFEPLRPIFGALMLALLAVGFWTVYGRRGVPVAPDAEGAESAPECCAAPPSPPSSSCARPARRGREVALLWGATITALVLWTFPTWSRWLL